jgi:RNA polymerase sigma-70 factor (ECF subfamily)
MPSPVQAAPAPELPKQSVIADVDRAYVDAARLDRTAFAPLYQKYVGPIFRYSYRRLGNSEAAEDATAQVFMKALAALPSHRQDGSTFRSWLFAIAHNVLVDAERTRQPRDDPDAAASLVDPAPGPEGEVLASEARHEVQLLLGSVPPEQRRVLQLRLAGLKTEEIADVLGMTTGAVRAAQCRAVKRLRLVMGLAPHGEGESDA